MKQNNVFRRSLINVEIVSRVLTGVFPSTRAGQLNWLNRKRAQLGLPALIDSKENDEVCT